MITQTNRAFRRTPLQIFSTFITTTLLFSNISILNISTASAQTIATTGLNLPPVGAMLELTENFSPVLVQGITIHPNDPLKFDFLLDIGENNLSDEQIRQESTRLAKYFLATLTVPEEELWVNLSPYEKDNMIPPAFGETEMGRDLLAQDYVLKQLTASLIYPEKRLGSEFWNRVFEKAQERFGTTDIPLNTFNKIWIVPDRAAVYEQGNDVFIVDSHLKVMLEEDYKALQQEIRSGKTADIDETTKAIGEVSSDVVREILIPEIEKEVNTGKTFANLRQVYSTMILAAWYKTALKESILGQKYVDQKKTFGVDNEDPMVNQKIYDQYLAAFKQGVYDFVKDEYDPVNREMVSRRYFSGGANLTQVRRMVKGNTIVASSPIKLSKKERDVVVPVLNNLTSRAGNQKIRRSTVSLAPQVGAKQQQEKAKTTAGVLAINLKTAGTENPEGTAQQIVSAMRGGNISQPLKNTLSDSNRQKFVVAAAEMAAPKLIEQNPTTFSNVLRENGIKNPEQVMTGITEARDIKPFFETLSQKPSVQLSIATAIVGISARDNILGAPAVATLLKETVGQSDTAADTLANNIINAAKPQDFNTVIASQPRTVQQQVHQNLAQTALDETVNTSQQSLSEAFKGEAADHKKIAKTVYQAQQQMNLDRAFNEMNIESPAVRNQLTYHVASLGVERSLSPEKVETALARSGVTNAPQIANEIKTQLAGKQNPVNVLATKLSSPESFESALKQIAVESIQNNRITLDEQTFASLGPVRAPQVAAQMAQVNSISGIDEILKDEPSSVRQSVLMNLAQPALQKMDVASLTQQLEAAKIEAPDAVAKEIVTKRPSTDLTTILSTQPAAVKETAMRELAQAAVAERENNPLDASSLTKVFTSNGMKAEQAQTIAQDIISGREATNFNTISRQNAISTEGQQRIAANLANGFISRGDVVARQIDIKTARPSDVGGIDFNPSMLALDIRKDGRGVPLPLSQQPLMNLPLDGFVPVVEDVQPVTNFDPVSGLNT